MLVCHKMLGRVKKCFCHFLKKCVDSKTHFLSKNVYIDVHCINGSKLNTVFNVFRYFKHLHCP